MNILLAEDNVEINKAVKTMLTRSGYGVDAAFDGEQAEIYMVNNGYDVIILDIMMPKKDGLEVLRNIRARDDITPIIMLTAKGEIEDRLEGLNTGADDYLVKPFSLKELLARVQAITRRHNNYLTSTMVYGDFCLSADGFELKCENTVRLSLKEYELLHLLMVRAGRKTTASTIWEHVWKKNEKTDNEIISLYISYLNGKLKGVCSSVNIIRANDNAYSLSTPVRGG